MSDDLINRQAAIELIEKESRKWGDEYGIPDVLCDLADMPSAQPERKKGKWIDAWRSAFDGTRHWHRECSECGYERDDDSIDKDTRFCPNCGAEMQKGEEDA